MADLTDDPKDALSADIESAVHQAIGVDWSEEEWNDACHDATTAVMAIVEPRLREARQENERLTEEHIQMQREIEKAVHDNERLRAFNLEGKAYDLGYDKGQEAMAEAAVEAYKKGKSVGTREGRAAERADVVAHARRCASPDDPAYAIKYNHLTWFATVVEGGEHVGATSPPKMVHQAVGEPSIVADRCAVCGLPWPCPQAPGAASPEPAEPPDAMLTWYGASHDHLLGEAPTPPSDEDRGVMLKVALYGYEDSDGQRYSTGEPVPPRRMQANEMSWWPLHWVEHDENVRCRATRLHPCCLPVAADPEETTPRPAS